MTVYVIGSEFCVFLFSLPNSLRLPSLGISPVKEGSGKVNYQSTSISPVTLMKSKAVRAFAYSSAIFL